MTSWINNTSEIFDIIISFLTTPPVFNIIALILFAFVCHIIHILIRGNREWTI